MKKILHAFPPVNVLIILVLSAALFAGMFYYLPPIDDERDEAIAKVKATDVSLYMSDDMGEVTKAQKKALKKMDEAKREEDLDKALEEYEASISEIRTKEDYIIAYVDQLKPTIKEINSKADTDAAVELVKKFRADGQKCESVNDLDMLYSKLRSDVSAFETKAQAKKKAENLNKLVGTWRVRGDSYILPFTLDYGNVFTMTYRKKGKEATLTGTWWMSGDTVTARIAEDSSNPDYEVYDWTFIYDPEAMTLSGTGDYAGRTYTKVA
jgi:hypothetical protein